MHDVRRCIVSQSAETSKADMDFWLRSICEMLAMALSEQVQSRCKHFSNFSSLTFLVVQVKCLSGQAETGTFPAGTYETLSANLSRYSRHMPMVESLCHSQPALLRHMSKRYHPFVYLVAGSQGQWSQKHSLVEISSCGRKESNRQRLHERIISTFLNRSLMSLAQLALSTQYRESRAVVDQ